MAKSSYYGFKAGQRVKTLTDCEDYPTLLPAGTEFTIDCFPPKVCVPSNPVCKEDRRQYFVFGYTDGKTNAVRISLENIWPA